jgi:hypothetical protein
MTPFDRASLSLSGSELPPPIVGGSPSFGGHVARVSGDGVAVDCASDTFGAATVTKRKGHSFRMCGPCQDVHGPLNVPTRLLHGDTRDPTLPRVHALWAVVPDVP